MPGKENMATQGQFSNDDHSSESGVGSEHHEVVRAQNREDRLLELLEKSEQGRCETDAMLRKFLMAKLSEPTTTTGVRTEAGPMVYSVMPDLSKSIQDFFGEAGEIAVEWLQRLNNCAVLHFWNEEIKLESARIHMVGPAKDWLKTWEDKIWCWEDFERQFKATFFLNQSVGDKWKRLVTRVQQPREYIEAYFHQKYKLCCEVKLEFSDAKEQILTGLQRKEFVPGLLANKHENANDLLHDILVLHRAIAPNARQSAYPTENYNHAVKQNNNNYPSESQDARRSDYVKSETPKPKCYNCAEVGHFSRDCNKPRSSNLCFLCKKDNHLKKDCPLNKRNTVMQVEENTESSKAILKFLRRAKVNDIKMDSFIDSGSAVCTIKSNCVHKIPGIKLKSTREKLFGFGGQAPVICNHFIEASIEIDTARLEAVKMFVVPNSVQHTEVIIGRSFTENERISYTKIGDNLAFGVKTEFPFADMEICEITERVKICSVNKQRLKANSINLVQVECQGDKFDVPIMNQEKVGQVIEKGQCIGKINRDVCGRDNEGMQCEAFLQSQESMQAITLDMLNIDKDIPTGDKQKLLNLCQEFRSCFAFNLRELGVTNLMKVDIVDNGIPVRAKPYRTNLKQRETINGIIKEWKQCGIVSETNSAYASPVLLVTKKTGEPRLVVDFRALNRNTVKTNFPIPTVDEHLECMSGATIFTTLDLAHGYLQMPLTEEAKLKTAFITPDCTGQFERLIFGLTNGPYEFSKLMNLALGSLRNQVAMSYLDDIIIPAASWEDMLRRLRLVFEALRKANLTLKIRKCEFGKKEVEYLGFIIAEGKLGPGKSKVRAIDEFPVPKDIHEVRRFLGLTSYFRRFVENYAVRARPLSELTKKNKLFEWGEKERSAFEDLKMSLITEPVLKLYNPHASETALFTDASSCGLSGLLMQKQSDDELHPVYYVSKKTTEVESKYHSSKLELMAIVYCFERLRNFLIGIHFTVFTDCQALVYLNHQKTGNSQITRWYNLLSEYDLELKYRPGVKMSHADALSRAPTDESCDTMDEIYERSTVMQTLNEHEYILMIQRSDRTVVEQIEALSKPIEDRTPHEKAISSGYILRDGKLYRVIKNSDNSEKCLYVIPRSLRKSIAIKYHDLIGHFSVSRTCAKIKENYWFPQMRRYIKQHIRMCAECLINKVPAGNLAGELHPIPPPSRPFGRIHVDHVGPLIKSEAGNVHILVVVDALTKFVKLYPVPSTKSNSTICALENFISQYGIPERIVTDRGTSFTSGDFKKFAIKHGIKHILNSSQWPRANGQVERVNRTLIPTVMSEMREENAWDEVIPAVERNLNIAPNQTTSRSPFEVLHGYLPKFHDGPLTAVTDIDATWTPSREIQKQVRETIRGEQLKQKARHDKKRFNSVKFNVGNIVFMRKVQKQTGESTKTQPKYRGPLEIVEVLASNTYRVASLQGVPGRRFVTTANVSQLKIFKANATDTESSDDSETGDDQPSTSVAGLVRDEPERVVTGENSAENQMSASRKRERKRPKRFDEFECE